MSLVSSKSLQISQRKRKKKKAHKLQLVNQDFLSVTVMPGLLGIRGVFQNDKQELLFMLSKQVEIEISMNQKVLVFGKPLNFILDSLWKGCCQKGTQLMQFHRLFTLESRPWKLQFFFNEIKAPSSHLQVAILHEVRSINSLADTLTTQGVDGLVPLVASTLIIVGHRV